MIVGVRGDLKFNWETPRPTHSAAALDIAKWVSGTYWRGHNMSPGTPTEAEERRIRSHNRKPPVGANLKPHRTLRDAIADLGEPTLVDLPHAKGHVSPPREARAYKGHTGSPWDQSSKALRAGGHGVSGGENMIDYGDQKTYRHFTAREAARLQDVDDNYEFPGVWSASLKQLGNMAPVSLSYAFGASVTPALAA